MSLLKAVVLPVLAFLGALAVSAMDGEFALLAKGAYAVAMMGLIAYVASRPQQESVTSR
jgi:hypothetical protein